MVLLAHLLFSLVESSYERRCEVSSERDKQYEAMNKELADLRRQMSAACDCHDVAEVNRLDALTSTKINEIRAFVKTNG